MLLLTGIYHVTTCNLVDEINEVINFLEKDKISYPSFNHIVKNEETLKTFLQEYLQILMERI